MIEDRHPDPAGVHDAGVNDADEAPTGPLPVITADLPDPRDPLGLGAPQRQWISDSVAPAARTSTPGAPRAHEPAEEPGAAEMGLDDLWDQAVALTQDPPADGAAAPVVAEPVPVAHAVADPAVVGPAVADPVVAEPAVADPLIVPGPVAVPQPVAVPERAAVPEPVAEPGAAPPGASVVGEPAALSPRWRAGIAASVAVAAVVVGIVAFHLASSSSSTQTAGGGPAFTLPSLATTASPTAGNALGPVPGLAALPPAVPTPSAAPAIPAGAPSVTVLNETRTKGLGAKEAAVIRGAGWTVRRVTNVNAVQPSTTVFYDTGQAAAARALMKAVPSVKAAALRPHYLLRTGGLIVVVAADAA